MLQIIQTALEVGLIYSLIALSLFISFSILNICDLSTDGCYTLGCAVGAMVTISGHPVLGVPAAMAAGICSGFITATLQTRFGVQSRVGQGSNFWFRLKTEPAPVDARPMQS